MCIRDRHKNGVAVIDFLNVTGVLNTLIRYEVKSIEGINFHIRKKIENGFIIKEISFEDKGESHIYEERVKFIDIDKFREYFKKSGLHIQHVFGDYDLTPFQKETSKRLIFVVS